MSNTRATPADDHQRAVAFHLAAITRAGQKFEENVVLAPLAADLSGHPDPSLAFISRNIARQLATIDHCTTVLVHLKALAILLRDRG